MIWGEPDMPGLVLVPSYRLHAVVPDAQHSAQPVPCPDSVPRPDVLDRTRAILRTHESAFPDAGVAAGTEAFDVFRGVRAEQLRLRPVGPSDDGAAWGLNKACAGVGVADAAGAFVHGGDAVAQGGGDDGDPVRHGAGQAGRPVDVLANVLGAGLRLSGAASGHEEPAGPVAGGWDLVGLGLPAGGELGSEEGGGALGDSGPVLGGHARIVTVVGRGGFRDGRRRGRAGRWCSRRGATTSKCGRGGGRCGRRRRGSRG